ncbi:hypothetical protein QWI17_13795 [Gilvimarinus sp. SDUM040013]|uniref:Tryptophan synthase subunit beta like protein n=1 Tax=Gilvimarinus gilvus TaxID=3058038 RepID=A0ABU4RVL3_9GAMM|nr:hypothetical protein [Gilvimarinus sp. SDUM040013]MDO3386914.1 hypothetical protein [Gilvimarinus sp. SDUM040013]MDX6848192.1 hypothetical protein [Gilvimarinus sp. SDUM040013]
MFVRRDFSGAICAISKTESVDCFEAVGSDSAELLAFLREFQPEVEQSLAESDLQMARVMEDVVNVLIDKSVICFTDLPEAAQSKLMHRKEMRGHFQAISLLDDDDDIKF